MKSLTNLLTSPIVQLVRIIVIGQFVDRIKLFWETNPEKRGLLTTLFILATLPLLVLAALTIQNLRQRAEAPVQILHTSGNPVTKTSDPDVLIKITLPDDWVLPQASPSGKNILVGNVHAQPACPNAGDPGTTTTCGATTYDTCVDNLGRFSTNSSFCSSGATVFRCYYSQNSSCISGASETDFNYSCSACPQSNQSLPTPTPITPSTSLCQTSCGACPTTTTFTYTTYDICEDNLRQSGTNLCKNGATAFRCYARENSNCASANPGVYNYSCPADIDVKACPKAGEAGTTTTYGTTTYDTCIDNKGGVNTNGTLCTGGATKFRCYYSQNDSCISGSSSSDFNYTCSMPSPTATPSPTPFRDGGGGGGGGGGAAPQPTATPTSIPPTPTPTPHILREINIENKDTDGSSSGSEPLRITANFADYLAKPVPWKLNRLKEGQDEASRIVQVTFFDGTTFVPYTATVILVRPTEKTGILSTVEVSFIDCQNLESIAIGTECHASALAYDAAMVPIFEGVTYEWGISSSNSIGTLDPTSGVTTTFSTKNVGTGDIWVIAKQDERFTKKSSRVQIVSSTESPTLSPGTGGPISTPAPSISPPVCRVSLESLDVFQSDECSQIAKGWGKKAEFTCSDKYRGTIESPICTTPGDLRERASSVCGQRTCPPEDVIQTYAADINGDMVVDTKDRDILVSQFGQRGTNLSGDINHDGVVDIFDYNILVENFGKRR